MGPLLAAVNAAFAGLPLPGLSLEALLQLYQLPEVLLAGGALAGGSWRNSSFLRCSVVKRRAAAAVPAVTGAADDGWCPGGWVVAPHVSIEAGCSGVKRFAAAAALASCQRCCWRGPHLLDEMDMTLLLSRCGVVLQHTMTAHPHLKRTCIPPHAGALSKLVDKLVSELGDLELVMDCGGRRGQLLGLPFEAVRLLLQVGGGGGGGRGGGGKNWGGGGGGGLQIRACTGR